MINNWTIKKLLFLHKKAVSAAQTCLLFVSKNRFFLSFLLFVLFLLWKNVTSGQFARMHLSNSLLIFLLSLGILLFICGFFLHKGRSVKKIEQLEQLIQQVRKEKSSLSYLAEKQSLFNPLGNALNLLFQELKEKTQQYQELHQQLNSMMHEMPLCVLLMNQDLNILLASTEASLFFNQENIKGKRLMEVVQHAELSHFVQEIVEKQQVQEKEFALFSPVERMVAVKVAPLLLEEAPPQYLLFLRDLSRIRELEQVNSDFVTNASHELRTPIASIKGFVETLQDGAAEDPATRQQFLAIVHKESCRLEHIVTDILRLSRMKNQELPSKEEVDLVGVMRAVCQSLAPQLKENSLHLICQIPEQVIYSLNKEDFTQVLVNLLANAICYTEENGQISLGVVEKENSVQIQVSDTGIGISSRDLPRIFERFYRVNKGRSRQSGGTGLGLAIVKELLDKMNATIEVKSQVGHGTTFTITLWK